MIPTDQANAPTGTEAEVCADIARRQAHGIEKYGMTVAENPLPLSAWIQHAYEESLDLPVYLKRARREALMLEAQIEHLRNIVKGFGTVRHALPEKPGFYWWRLFVQMPWRLVRVTELRDERGAPYLMTEDIQHKNWSGRSIKTWACHMPTGEWMALPTPPLDGSTEVESSLHEKASK